MRTALLALLLTACGGPATVAGDIGGTSFEKAKSAWFGGGVIVIVDEDIPCDQMGWVQRLYTEDTPADGRREFAAVQIAFRGDITEGPFLTDRVQGVSADGLVNLSDSVEVHHAREGEIMIDSISPSSITGSFSMAFGVGGVAGDFDAKSCVNIR